METESLDFIYPYITFLHIAAGTTGLVSGGFAILVNKGSKAHRKAGLIFFWAMNAVAFSAFALSGARQNLFLFVIGVFSFYMNFTGYRALKNKSAKFKVVDWVVTILSLLSAAFMVSTGNPVLVTFGIILSCMLVINSRAQFQGEEKIAELKRKRVLTHLGNMSGTYLSASTAFVVVNVNFIKPFWVVWLLPTAIGLPFIIYNLRVWKAKLKIT